MNPIKSISIKNFRSIRELKDLPCSNFNILIGMNDQGKSNLLRALDLFFNYGISYNFNWETDFCLFHNTAPKKAQEIKIIIKFNLPESFSIREASWEKTWRSDGINNNKIIILPKKDTYPPQRRGKVEAYLKGIRYEYVPAIKGEEYFKSLMEKIHNVLSNTIKTDFSSASTDFIKNINQKVKPLISDLSNTLDHETSITLPKTLVGLFRALDISAKIGNKILSLNQRGDGIRIRHIPIILKWLANQSNTIPGRRIDTIWGYEEPENNLELGMANKIAKQFNEISKTIQTFVTTHSPAFYSIYKKDNTIRLFTVKKDLDKKICSINIPKEIDPINSALGLMHLLSSYQEEAYNLLEISKKLGMGKETIFCEGKSDEVLLKKCLNLFYPDLEKSVLIHGCESANDLKDKLIAWMYMKPENKAIGIFDYDTSGKKAKDDFNKEIQKRKSNKIHESLKAIYYHPIGTYISRLLSIAKIEYSIEELFSPNNWKYAKGEDWLEKRKTQVEYRDFDQMNKSLRDHFKDKNVLEEEVIVLQSSVREYNKKNFSNYLVRNTSKDEFEKVLKPTLDECLKFLGLIK